MAGYRIWFSMDNFVFELPVNPQDVTITHPANSTNYDVEGIGEIVIPRLPKLRTLSFDSFFPREMIWQPMVNDEQWYPPEWYVNFFKLVQKKRQPLEITISRGYDTVFEYDEGGNRSTGRTDYFDTILEQAVVLDFSITDKGGEPGDIYYSMSISEYKDASPKILAEVAEETYDDETGELLSQKKVLVVNRPQQTGRISEKRSITIFGMTFELPDFNWDDWMEARQTANGIDALVTRILPPGVSGTLHSVFVNGVGWTDKTSCKLAENVGTLNSVSNLMTSNYD